jgi:NADPH:quinone reductase-like Zn-dependent oxidoreductase
LDYTSNKGVDVIADPVMGSHFNENIKCLAMESRWVLYSTLGGIKVKDANLVNLLLKRATIYASTLKSRDDQYKTELVSSFFEEISPYFKEAPRGKQKLVPVIDRVFKMSEAALAHEYMESNQTIGKVVLVNDLQ